MCCFLQHIAFSLSQDLWYSESEIVCVLLLHRFCAFQRARLLLKFSKQPLKDISRSSAWQACRRPLSFWECLCLFSLILGSRHPQLLENGVVTLEILYGLHVQGTQESGDGGWILDFCQDLFLKKKQMSFKSFGRLLSQLTFSTVMLYNKQFQTQWLEIKLSKFSIICPRIN